MQILLKTVNWALEQVPIGGKGTVLPPVSGISTTADVNRETLLTNLQSVLSNAKTTNTGWTLDGKEKDAFMAHINALDFTPALTAETIRDGVKVLLEALKMELEKHEEVEGCYSHPTFDPKNLLT